MFKPIAHFGVMCVVLATTSSSQTHWTKYAGNPVLEPTSGTWDAATVVAQGFIRFQDTLKTWYMASASGTDYRIGYAWSVDGGITWTKDTLHNPVLIPTQPWEMNSVLAPNVIFTGAEYKMWYVGAFGLTARIGYAWSNDGITWTKHQGNPVLIPGPSSWDNVIVSRPYVLGPDSAGVFKMWYHGYDGTNLRIGYAWSTDGGIAWTKHPSPVLGVGPTGSWDDRNVGHPTVLHLNGQYQMLYHGNRDNPFLNSTSQIGYATSPDETTWTKVDTPVVRRGPGSWESVAVFPGTVLFENNTYRMWYTGDDGTSMRIGYATAPVIPSVEELGGALPDRFTLLQNYPNPFNPSTNIRFKVPGSGFVSLKVYNLLGQEVATLVNEELKPGSYEARWDGNGFASGVYLYRLTAGSFTETKRMLLLK